MSFLKGYFGEIQSVNEENYTARVKIPELDDQITGDLQIFSSLTFSNSISALPKSKTPCFVIFVDDESQRGLVLGGLFTDENRCNPSTGKMVIDFQETRVTLDETGKVDVETGNVSVRSKTSEITSNTVKVTANKITLDSDVEITGEVKILKDLKLGGAMATAAGMEVDSAGVISTPSIIKAKDFVKI